MKSKFFRYGLLAASLIVTLAAVFYMRQLSQQSTPALPVVVTLPAFTLTDQQAKAFSSQTLMGKVWIADFVFTSCQGQCPLLSNALMQVAQQYPDAAQLQLVSISVDPENDQPAALKAYAKRFGANDQQWHFLTGDRLVIKELMNSGFKIGSEDDPNLHSTYLVLVDQKNQIRGYYDGLDANALKKLHRDLKTLL